MEFIAAFLGFSVKYIFLLGVCVGAAFLGAALRMKKNKSN